MLAIGEEWSGIGARYERGELEYASGYEKMYGVTDEQLAFLSWHQGNLCRFAVQPIYDAALEADLERLALPGWAPAAGSVGEGALFCMGSRVISVLGVRVGPDWDVSQLGTMI